MDAIIFVSSKLVWLVVAVTPLIMIHAQRIVGMEEILEYYLEMMATQEMEMGDLQHDKLKLDTSVQSNLRKTMTSISEEKSVVMGGILNILIEMTAI